MTENMKKFMEAAEQDKTLAERLDALETAEDLVALAEEKGFALTEEDLLSLAPATGELDDSELEDVSGGSFLTLFWKGNGFGTKRLKYTGGAKYSKLGGIQANGYQGGIVATKLGGVHTGGFQSGIFATKLGDVADDDDEPAGGTTTMRWTKV